MPRVLVFWKGLVSLSLLLGGCGPGAAEMRRSDIDRRVSALQPGTHRYGHPRGFAPMPLREGQWARYKKVDQKGNPSFVTYRVAGEQEEGFWIEIAEESYRGRTLHSLLVSLGGVDGSGSVEVLAMEVTDTGGRVTAYSPQDLSAKRSLWEPLLLGMGSSWHNLPQEDATVPAGIFAGCFMDRSTVSVGMFKKTTEIWTHPLVPITGMVSRIDVADLSSMELVAFGLEGGE